MSALHSAVNEDRIDEAAPDLAAIQKELAALKEHLASISQLIVGQGGESAGEAIKRISAAGKETAVRAQVSIRDRPLLSVLIAFIIGLVFGRVFTRK